MPAGRRVWAPLAIVMILLSACSTGSGTHSRAWYRGYEAGVQARQHHHFTRSATGYDRIAFCADRAYWDIQKMKRDLVQWTEGFDQGCGNLLAPAGPG